MGLRQKSTSVGLATLSFLAAACTSLPDIEITAAEEPGTTTTSEPSAGASTTPPPVAESAGLAATTVPAAEPLTNDSLLAGGVDIGSLVTLPDGSVLVQPTPEPLRNRQLATMPRLPAPVGDTFEFSINALEGEPRERSTWNELCPVPPTSLRYVTVSFWGFDGGHHTGELIVAANEAENIVTVFEKLHAVQFPIEEMRIVTPADVVARRTGDGNNTASFVCRLVTGGSSFSQHAFGLAVDINPFQNPYQRDDEVIPALASAYLDRTDVRPGMIVPGDPNGDVVLDAFAAIGWGWGGGWNSLKDYQHFSRNNR